MRPIVIRPGGRRRPNPLLALYRWRYEAGLLVVVVALVQLGQATHAVVPWLLVLAVAATLATVPRARRAVATRARSVVVQHRLRTVFHELALTTWARRIPAILWTTPCAEGLRVHVLCPAGVTADDLRSAREDLAAACFAAEVRVERDPRHANVVVLVVVIRESSPGTPVPD